MISRIRDAISDSILVRPLAFILAGMVLAPVVLAVDWFLPDLVPQVFRFPPGTARALLTTLAGATLTIAGITFWVRAASVQLASSQYSPRVVHGFLQDWFQQSMMGLLVGFFAFIVAVLRAVPDVQDPGVVELGEVPHLSVMVAIALAGASVLVVLVAIRNAVRSMQPGELARRITDDTVDAIHDAHPRRGQSHESEDLGDHLPSRPGISVRATDSGWVRRIHEGELLDVLPPGAAVALHVRVGLYVVPGRALCSVWTDGDLPEEAHQHMREAITLGRGRSTSADIHHGIQQLVDVALGSLAHGAGDAPSAYEVIVHLELVLRELLWRDLPPVVTIDPEGRVLERQREFTFADYVGESFDRLRLASAPHPVVAAALLDVLGTLVADLTAAGLHRRAEPLRRQARLVIATVEAEGRLEEDMAPIRRVAARHGFAG